MFDAMANSRDWTTGRPTTPKQEFERLVRMAVSKKVDLILLGGDIVNFPTAATVSFVREQMSAAGIPYVYTSGNHDWMLEGQPEAASYDADRLPELRSTLWPLVGGSAALEAASGASGGPSADGPLLRGCVTVKGIDIVVIDNGNYQVDDEQLSFFQACLSGGGCGRCAASEPIRPMLLLLHIPLALPGLDVAPKESCGHPSWGEEHDENHGVEARASWPASNLPSTPEFLRLVQASASPAGPLRGVLAGHVHRETAVPLAPAGGSPRAAPGAARVEVLSWSERSPAGSAAGDEVPKQYTTHLAAEGGHRRTSPHQDLYEDHKKRKEEMRKRIEARKAAEVSYRPKIGKPEDVSSITQRLYDAAEERRRALALATEADPRAGRQQVAAWRVQGCRACGQGRAGRFGSVPWPAVGEDKQHTLDCSILEAARTPRAAATSLNPHTPATGSSFVRLFNEANQKAEKLRTMRQESVKAEWAQILQGSVHRRAQTSRKWTEQSLQDHGPRETAPQRREAQADSPGSRTDGPAPGRARAARRRRGPPARAAATPPARS
ncbi:unnamed protein product, partial [Prorocentrum cordatum]